MKDVAMAANVSLKTVSRVINHAPNVHPDLADRVLDAVADLKFRRNDIAASLRSGGASQTIGLVIEDLANPFYSMLASGVSKVARDRDSLLIISSLEERQDLERDVILALCRRRVDGLLVVPAGPDHTYLRTEVEMGLPLVFLDRPPSGVMADSVTIDNHGGARYGMEHLVATGHRRIAVLLDSLAIYTMQERLAGARAALAKSNILFDEASLRVDLHDPEAACTAVLDLLASPSPPTALFCANNRITIGAIQALATSGRDAAVVGFDDFELSYLMPRPMTIVSCDSLDLGRVGAELLYARIDGDDSPPRSVVLPTQLVQRSLAVGPGAQ